MPFYTKKTVFWPRGETRLLIAFSYRLELLTQAANFEDTKSLPLSFRWNDEGKQAVKTKAECFKAWRLFLFSLLFLSNMHYWLSVRWSIWLDIWPNSFFFFLHFVRVSKSPFFFLVRYATRLRRSLGRCATSCIEARLRSLLRTYERSTCRKSCMLFTDTKSGPMKKRTSTPIYTTCTSPIMHLLCPPKFSVSTILNFPWDGEMNWGGGK